MTQREALTNILISASQTEPETLEQAQAELKFIAKLAKHSLDSQAPECSGLNRYRFMRNEPLVSPRA